jgi:hypothetical protein
MAASSATVDAPEREITRWLCAIRQVAEERRDFDGEAEPVIGVEHPRDVLVAGLLGDRQPRPQRHRHKLDGGRHHVGHDAGALAAAEDQDAQRPAGIRIGYAGRCDDGRPDRISGVDDLGAEFRIIGEQPGKAGGDGLDATAQQPVGAAKDGVRLVDHCRDVALRRGKQRRKGRIAAEADHGGGLHLLHQAEAHDGTATQFDGGAGETQRIWTCEGCARDDSGRAAGKIPVAGGALVGKEIDSDAALPQREGEGLGRKQVSPCPAGSHENERLAAVLITHTTPPAIFKLPGDRRSTSPWPPRQSPDQALARPDRGRRRR